MRAYRKSMALALGLVLGLAGCASRPTDEVDLARTMLNKAVTEGADNFAAESLKAAREAETALEAEMQIQEGKWFRSYNKAVDLAIEVQAAANEAAAEAAAAKEKTMAAAIAGSGAERYGPNLFRNGRFAEGLQGWSRHLESDADVTIDVSRSDQRVWSVKYRKGNWSVIYQEVILQPDTVYVYDATVKSTAPVVVLYWQADIGRFLEADKTYPEWTHLRYVILTPHWSGQPYRTGFNPVLMKGTGDAWIRDLRLSEFKAEGR